MFGATSPATCFPNGSGHAAFSWDDMILPSGWALHWRPECQDSGVNLLLAPASTCAVRRLPAGPMNIIPRILLISGEHGGCRHCGLQHNGVGASLKHFACNNSEVERTTMSPIVEERALREIYLGGLRAGHPRSAPWTVMSLLQSAERHPDRAEHHWLSRPVLREDWGYDGLVVSDWHGIKDRPARRSMPATISTCRKARAARPIFSQRWTVALFRRKWRNLSCQRMLDMIRRCNEGSKAPLPVYTAEEHHGERARDGRGFHGARAQ